MEQWDAQLQRELPPGADIFDAHTHLGTDIDGMLGVYDDLIRGMEKYGISRCFMFCLDEPDRHPGFQAGNDRTLAYAERSDGKLIPFVRLDLSEDPIGEAVRCLDRGAKGIKLHPRALKFLLNDDRLSPIFELSAERNVPVLIHGGRGLPPIADDLGRVVDRYPKAQLIVAHAGIADMAALAERLAGGGGGVGRARRASSSTRPSGARSTCSASTGSSARSRSCTRRTIPTASSRRRSWSRSARRVSPASPTSKCVTCWQGTPTGSPPASSRVSLGRQWVWRPSPSR